MDLSTLRAYCAAHSNMRWICKDRIFWEQKIITDFGIINPISKIHLDVNDYENAYKYADLPKYISDVQINANAALNSGDISRLIIPDDGLTYIYKLHLGDMILHPATFTDFDLYDSNISYFRNLQERQLQREAEEQIRIENDPNYIPMLRIPDYPNWTHNIATYNNSSVTVQDFLKDTESPIYITLDGDQIEELMQESKMDVIEMELSEDNTVTITYNPPP